MSIDGLPKGYLFRGEWYIKGYGVGPRGRASPYKDQICRVPPTPTPTPHPLAADVRRIKTPLLRLPISSWSSLQVKEVFGAGTACVVCPVNRILYEGQVRKAKTKKG